MKRLILAFLMLMLALPLAASAQQLKAAPAPVAGQVDDLKVVWGGGDPKGSVYSSTYVPHVIKVLETKRLSGYRWGGISQGTLQNAEIVTSKPTNLAVVQLDISRQLNGQDIPGQTGKRYQFTIIHEDIGPECLYVVTKEKNYSTFGHVRANNFDLTVLTGGPKSGSYGTWQILQSLHSASS